MWIEGKEGKSGRGSTGRGHFGKRTTEFTQNTVLKGQGFEGLVGLLKKKKKHTINEIENLSSP